MIEIDLQKLHHLGCGWSENGHMFLHQGPHILIKSIDSAIDELHLQTISSIEIPGHLIATMSTKRTGTCTPITQYVYEMHDINKILITQNHQFGILPAIYLNN